jgi:hypothetical protein
MKTNTKQNKIPAPQIRVRSNLKSGIRFVSNDDEQDPVVFSGPISSARSRIF